ncbi:heme-binding protein [Phenylobacterium sp. LjRoot219]|uniref:GlcG/HbpS family heme-binding protein n=1 Tax=Phenylobacterium sp. LjRoot219 TaxID=3342283 RepID=UPI003ED09D0E
MPANELTLAQANTIVEAALKEGARLKLKPLTVAVLDAGGHTVALQRQDGASNLRPQIATAKAAGALALGVSSRQIGAMAQERPHFVGALAALGAGAATAIVPVAGGVLIRSSDDRIIGAVGITGDTSDNDEACALAGVAAAGLSAQA